MDKIGAMRLFVRSVQLGGFTAAAVESNTTQSSVSKKIAALEQNLGVPLLYRTSRKQELTDAGRRYFEFSLKFLAELDNIEGDLLDEQQTLSGRLNVSAPIAFGQRLLPEIVASFNQQYPLISLNLTLSDKISDLVADDIDIAIRAHKLEDSQLKARYLFENKALTVASPSYLAKFGTPSHPNDLEAHQCLLYALSDTQHLFFKIDNEITKQKVKSRISSNNADTLLSLCIKGLGVAALPSWMVEDEIKNNRLSTILDDYNGMSLPMYAIYKQSDYTPLRVRYFIDHLVQSCGLMFNENY
ncbi:LysR family transcriptional regulator [Vibrio mexicanus]|uniref:LysR family transcriptional regulator n=1 Tax=Vibrio mexicanus TaxID=1004326 RepID=UPI00063CF036|nr:LysR family transcriptional regulator [Vibrio mexicanus]